jgi:tRNA1(Val) A37 N6-methylase TrmN6
VPAKLILLAGRRDSRAPDRVATGLVLHAADGGFTAAAAAILRDGAALTL